MDVVERKNVNVQNAVIVSGITLTELDQVLETYLLRFGSVRRKLVIEDPDSDFHHNAVVEFTHDSAMCNLEPQLPLTIVSPTDPDTVFRVRTLASVHTLTTSSAIAECPDKLQAAASADRESPQDVLQESIKLGGMRTLNDLSLGTASGLERRPSEINLLTHAASTPQRLERCNSPPVLRIEPENPVKATLSTMSPRCSNDADISSAETISVKLPMSAVQPPGIQRVVMEHIVRTSDSVSPHNASFRLKAFSGRSPRPSNKPDFDTWRASVDYLLNDPFLPESHKMRKILDSLLPPASDIIKHVNPNAPSSECLRLLESVYGSVEDGDELLAKFISTLQNPGERSSAYLHRLHVILCATIRRGGIAESERDRCLLKQFCRGCWDNSLIVDLQLEKRKADPPPFAELAILIRTIEEKQTSKEERMRKHLGVSKHPSVPLKLKTVTHQQSVYPCRTFEEDVTETPTPGNAKQKASKQKGKTQFPEMSEVGALKKEIAALQSQIIAIRTTADQKVKERAETNELEELRKQIAELKVQVATSGAQRNHPERPPHLRNSLSRSTFNEVSRKENERPQYAEMRSNRPRPWYCFRCGDDGHLAINCENGPNPSRVEEKRRNGIFKMEQQQADGDWAEETKP
ncbi:hypothetical protein M9458_052899 [Cirrhinus mrigala]|uniref:CCHC-type domain-containing protein n=1 Tax=Cirrhinus mrigala TaxID=683832 RepID=A0ABD0MSP0_CIRMR